MQQEHTGQRLATATYPTSNRNRLPTLTEVLTRKTAPPVCLYNYYLYMRDREHASEYLDFYLDVLEHEILCKAFVKDLKKLGLDVNIEYPDFVMYRPGGISEKGQMVQRHLSASSRGSDNTVNSAGVFDFPSRGSDNKLNSSGVFDPPSRPESPQHIINMPSGSKPIRHRDSVRSNKTSTTTGNLSFYGRERPYTKEDLIESAERIYFKYIFQGAEKELVELSNAEREKIAHAIDIEEGSEKRSDPWIYHEAKKEIFDLMEKDYFPRFLQARAFGNMNVLQTMLRLALGLFLLFVGFAVALSLIFLDVSPKAVRIWSFIPIFMGVVNLYANQSELSPLFVILKISETKFFKFQRVMEPYIYKLHIKKGLNVIVRSLIVSAIITIIFVVVPGHRL